MAVATNLGTGGSVLDAQYGSSSTPNTNEPLLLGHTGTNYLYLPGVAGNYASTPDSAALDITGDIDIRVRVALNDWTPSASSGFLSKWGGTLSYLFYVNTSGNLVFESQVFAATSTVVTGITDGATGWVRVAVDVDNGAGGKSVTFYTATDQSAEPSSWSQLGSVVTTAGTVTLPTGATQVAVGAWDDGASGPAAAKVYRAQVLNGIGGTTVFDADFTTGITSGAQTTFTESSSNAATVTINRSTAGRKACAVVRPVWLLGTDDFFEVADNALLDFGSSDSFTVVAVVRQWGTYGPNNSHIVSKRNDGVSVGWHLIGFQPGVATTLNIHDGTTSVNSGNRNIVSGNLSVLAGVRDTAADTLVTSLNGSAAAPVTDTTTGTLSNSLPMRVGSNPSNTFYASSLELLAVAVFRRALTAAELSSIATYYGAA